MSLVFPTFTQEQFTLLVEASGAWLHHPRLAAEGLYAATPDQAADLAHLLLAAPQQSIVVLADDAGQEIRLDAMPLLRGMDRRRLIVRRVQQHFPGAPFAACIATQRDATQEKLMILHLPVEGAAPDWVRWHSALPNPPGGTLATTRLAAAMLWRLAGNELAEWLHGFFLTPDGWRQVTLHQGQPILTRQIPLSTPTPEMLATTLQQALRDAQNFLARFGWREDQSEQIIGVVPQHQLEPTRLQLPPALLLLTSTEVGRWLKLPQPVADWRQLCVAAARHYRATLTPHLLPYESDALQHHRIAQWGTSIAAALLIGALTLTGYEGIATQTVRAQLAAAETDAHSIEQTRQAALHQMGDVARARIRLRQARMLQQDNAPSPWPLLLALGKSLPEQVRLNHLDWEVLPTGGVNAVMKVRVLSPEGNKDAVQQDALQRFTLFAKDLQLALPVAKVEALQVPYALAAHQTFNDTQMLQTVAVGEASGELAVKLP
ncbi:MAG: hypothetical protein KBA75_04190 [Alphaproteobacteria bacterium]|nr:hypothetical protein [Alphaproteobacteria bacterium]